ncbi:MAG: VTT domain-containing protein [Chloroflexi bacterium]|nr:VTT domain-containing protein [Chloroflexota bacterium]
MDSFDTAFEAYGLAAVCVVMLTKSAGIPLPVPGDFILLATAARVGQGKLVLWQAFGALLVAVVVGGTLQFAIARGPGRGAVYRFGRFAGLHQQRLDTLANAIRRRGTLSLALALFTPGVRNAAVPACGLAGLSVSAFVPSLILASAIDLALHFVLGVFGGTLLDRFRPDPLQVVFLVIAAAVLGLAGWLVLSRRRRGAEPRNREALAAWEASACPACLGVAALGIGLNDADLFAATPDPTSPGSESIDPLNS